KRAAHWRVEARSVQRLLLAEVALGCGRAKSAPLGKRQVLGVEQVVNLKIRFEFETLPYAEYLGCPQVDVDVAPASRLLDLAVLIDDESRAHAVDFDLRAALRIQSPKRGRVSASSEDRRRIDALANSINC